MQREYHKWQSPHLDREMELLIFGHEGAKVLVFPTRNGRFYEYENLGIVKALEQKIEAGFIQLFCVDSMDHESFYCKHVHPAQRIERHIAYEAYVIDEVLPFMTEKNANPSLISHGCSLGAFHAANLCFRHPELFVKLVAFSGRYDLTHSVESFCDLFDGYYDNSIYYHTPSHFLPNLEDSETLELLRRLEITFTIGREDPFLFNNQCLSEVLHSKHIAHSLHIWDERAHKGAYWRAMAPLYL